MSRLASATIVLPTQVEGPSRRPSARQLHRMAPVHVRHHSDSVPGDFGAVRSHHRQHSSADCKSVGVLDGRGMRITIHLFSYAVSASLVGDTTHPRIRRECSSSAAIGASTLCFPRPLPLKTRTIIARGFPLRRPNRLPWRDAAQDRSLHSVALSLSLVLLLLRADDRLRDAPS